MKTSKRNRSLKRMKQTCLPTNFSKSMNDSCKDREIRFLFLMKELYAEISKLIGLDVATITNIVSAKRKELNEYLNRSLT